jgi:hypothetical protein
VRNSTSQKSNDLILEAKAFFDGLNSSTVVLKEITNEHDPGEDYFVETELIFEPISLSECWLALQFTDDGSVGFGIENSGRLRARLRGSALWSYAPPFIGGREPISLSKDDLLDLIRSIATADMTLIVWTMFGGVIATSLKVSGKQYAVGDPIGRALGRLSAIFGLARKRELTFAPWSSEASSRLR